MAKTETVSVSPGDRVRDRITGLTGIVQCRTEWLFGCVRLTVQPEEHKNGKAAEQFSIDEEQAVVMQESVIVGTHQAKVGKERTPAGDRGTAPSERAR